MKPQIPILASAAAVVAADASVPGATSYVVPTAFPTTVYSSYYGKIFVTKDSVSPRLMWHISQPGADPGTSAGHL